MGGGTLPDSDEDDSTQKSGDVPLDDSVYISDDDDTYEQTKKKLIQLKDSAADTASKAGELAVHGAKEVATGAKTFASKTKVAFDDAREKRRQKKAEPAPEPAPTDPRGELQKWTVAELKESLRELGLAVSGRKDELISRLLGEDVVQQPEPEPEVVPVEPEPDEQEVVAEPEPEVEEIVADTPLEQEGGGGQFVVHDLPRTKSSSGSWKANRVNSSISMIFGFLMFLYALSIVDNAFEVGLFKGIMGYLNDSIAERVLRSYGGMEEIQRGAFSGLLTFLFFSSSLLFISGKRQSAAALVAMIGLLASFTIRIIAASEVNAFAELDVVGYLIYDLVLSIPFAIMCWIPALTRSALYSDDVVSTDFVMVQSEQSALSEPESITDADDDGHIGEDMGEFSTARPIPPKRRQKMSYSLYELIFLFLSLCIWPFTIGTHIVMALGIRIEGVKYTGDLEAHGMTLLLPLYILCGICTIAVIKFDREAREGEVYAKEKLAYHRDMDQFLLMKKAHYEKAAERLGATPSNDDE